MTQAIGPARICTLILRSKDYDVKRVKITSFRGTVLTTIVFLLEPNQMKNKPHTPK